MLEQDFTQILKNNRTLLGDKKRFAGLIKDLIPGQQLQSNLIIALHEMSIHSEIEKAPQITNAFAFRFVKQLSDERGVSRMNADWAVSAWCVCYGKDVLGKSCEIKISDAKSGKAPSIREEKSGTKQYQDLFRFKKNPNSIGFEVAGFVGDNMRTLILPNRHQNQSVTAISESAFSECDVQEAVMTEGIKVIGARAFIGCSQLKQIIFSEDLIEIGDSAFSGCSSLTTAMLPSKIQRIGNYAFASTALKSPTLPDSVFALGEGVYSHCTSITEISIPKGIILLQDKLFFRCTALKNITLHNKLEGIGSMAFAGCAKLHTIVIPDSVVHIGECAFNDLSEKFLIICGKGSCAEKYARANKINFQLS